MLGSADTGRCIKEENGRMAEEERKGILQALYTRTKVLGLTALIAEALFLGAATLLPEDQVLYALIVCATILVITILGIVRIGFGVKALLLWHPAPDRHFVRF